MRILNQWAKLTVQSFIDLSIGLVTTHGQTLKTGPQHLEAVSVTFRTGRRVMSSISLRPTMSTLRLSFTMFSTLETLSHQPI